MLKIAVCEDIILERLDIIKKIKSALIKLSCSFDVEQFTSGEQLLNYNGYFDVIFLDIKLKNLSGIDTAKELRKTNIKSKIIFVTSFKEYVFEAFDVCAFHYLLKPVSEEKISSILSKILYEVPSDDLNNLYIIIKKGKDTIKILLDKIYFFEVQNRIISIHTKDSTIEYYNKISNIEASIPKNNFFRCHRSYIVNLKYVKRFCKTEILLDNDEKILLSKNKYSEFSEAFLKYLKKGMV